MGRTNTGFLVRAEHAAICDRCEAVGPWGIGEEECFDLAADEGWRRGDYVELLGRRERLCGECARGWRGRTSS